METLENELIMNKSLSEKTVLETLTKRYLSIKRARPRIGENWIFYGKNITKLSKIPNSVMDDPK